VRAGPNHTPHPTEVGCGSGLEKPNQESAKILRPDSSGPNSAPRPVPSHGLAFHTLTGSTNSNTQVPGLMVNVPQSEAPLPKNIRLGNNEWTGTLAGNLPMCSLERR
jgi:hypothetical protein